MTTDSKPKHDPGITIKRLILPIILVAVGAGVAYMLIKSKPKAKRRERTTSATLVELMPLRKTREQVKVQGMGTVEASRQVALQPRVSGEVIEVSKAFVPGGAFKVGEMMLRLDPVDYEILVTQRRADLAKAENDYQVELGRQAIARRDWELASKGGKMSSQDKALVLRQPQLRQAKTALESSRAILKKAELDLARTTIRAPFNAIIRSRGVEKGAQVTSQTTLATLTGYDEYWVHTTLPAEKLRWIPIPGEQTNEKGARSTVSFGQSSEICMGWTGTVLRRLVELETQGRMAQLIVQIKDPLGLLCGKCPKRPLLIGSYVDVELEGITLDNVYRIPRTALRDNNTVWLMTQDNTLEIRSVKIIWTERDTILMRNGFTDGDRLIVSDISVPVAGLPLRVQQAKASPAEEEATAPKPQASGKGDKADE